MKQMNPYHQKSMSEVESHALQRSQIMLTSTVESSTLTSPTVIQMTENTSPFNPLGRLRKNSLENNESIFKSAASKLLSPLSRDKFFQRE